MGKESIEYEVVTTLSKQCLAFNKLVKARKVDDVTIRLTDSAIHPDGDMECPAMENELVKPVKGSEDPGVVYVGWNSDGEKVPWPEGESMYTLKVGLEVPMFVGCNGCDKNEKGFDSYPKVEVQEVKTGQ